MVSGGAGIGGQLTAQNATFLNPPTWTLGSGTHFYSVNDSPLPLTNELNVSGIPSWVRKMTIQIYALRQQNTTARPRLMVGTTNLFTTGVNGAIFGNQSSVSSIAFDSGLIYLWNTSWPAATKQISGEITITKMSSTFPNPNHYTLVVNMCDDNNSTGFACSGFGVIETTSSTPLQQFSIFTGGTSINFTQGRYAVIFQ